MTGNGVGNLVFTLLSAVAGPSATGHGSASRGEARSAAARGYWEARCQGATASATPASWSRFPSSRPRWSGCARDQGLAPRTHAALDEYPLDRGTVHLGVAGDGALLHVEAFAFVGLGDGDDAGVAVNPTRGAKGEGRGLARRQPLQRRPAPRARRAGLT